MHMSTRVSIHCKWNNCSLKFDCLSDIESHILANHLTPNERRCQWFGCHFDRGESVSSVDFLKEHLLKHIKFDAFCANAARRLEERGLLELNNVCSLPCMNFENLFSCEWMLDENVDDVKPLSIITDKPATHPTQGPLLDETFYACHSCREVFPNESLLLQHLISSANKVSLDDSVELDKVHCRWFGCNRSFSSYIRLHAHVTTLHNQPDSLPICLWRHCENSWVLWTGTPQMKRHLLMHVFVEHHLQLTKKALSKRATDPPLICRGIQYQKMSSTYRTASFLLWQPDVLEHGFHCCWWSCEFRTDSAILFVDHVIMHAAHDPTLPDKWSCQWKTKSSSTELWEAFEPCNIVVANVDKRRNHLYRHTGLPRLICESCQVCFIEMHTFEEHYRWSLPAQREVTMASDSSECGRPESEQPPQPTLLKCPHCTKRFVTKHALTSHARTCRMKPRETADPTASDSNNNRSSVVRSHKRVAESNALAAKAAVALEQEQKLFLCQVTGCDFQSSLYSAYRYHFKRYHSSINLDGLWYACHLCASYRTRKSTTMTRHFRGVHRLKPPDGHNRFVYSEDPEDGVYRLIWRSLRPKPNMHRPILPRSSSISGPSSST